MASSYHDLVVWQKAFKTNFLAEETTIVIRENLKEINLMLNGLIKSLETRNSKLETE